jgi:hypothetical protein
MKMTRVNITFFCGGRLTFWHVTDFSRGHDPRHQTQRRKTTRVGQAFATSCKISTTRLPAFRDWENPSTFQLVGRLSSNQTENGQNAEQEPSYSVKSISHVYLFGLSFITFRSKYYESLSRSRTLHPYTCACFLIRISKWFMTRNTQMSAATRNWCCKLPSCT